METLEDGAQLYRMSAAGNWHVAVDISEAEQRAETAGGVVPQHTGGLFTARSLYVHAYAGGGEPRWQVSGPNIRQDGSAGRYTLRRVITRECAEQAYPRALAGLVTALARLAWLVRADADTACAEIAMALPGWT
jgi:hypothetical protein